MMQPIVGEVEKLAASLQGKAPQIPIFSTATGKLLTAEQAMSPGYWAMQLRQPVLFSAAVNSAREYYQGQQLAFVEVGPGAALSSLVATDNVVSTKPVKVKNTLASCASGSCVDEKFIDEFNQCLNTLWVNGFEIDWRQREGPGPLSKVKLPNYNFDKKRFWLEKNSAPAVADSSQLSTQQPIQQPIQKPPVMQEVTMSAEQHRQQIELKLRNILEDVTGLELAEVEAEAHFSEVGLDSLALTQAATAIDQEFSIGLTFRHLVEDYSSIAELSDFVAEQVPPATTTVAASTMVDTTVGGAADIQATLAQMMPTGMAGPSNMSSDVQLLIQQQLKIMQMQLQALSGTSAAVGSQPVSSAQMSSQPVLPAADKPAMETNKAQGARQTPGTRIVKESVGVNLTKAQRQWLDEVLDQYQKKYAGSKAYTQKYRKILADPRTVSGFNPEWKEIIFPIVTERSKGSKLWDIDGNELIDTSNGFGPIFFGHSPDFVTQAVQQQLAMGIETGPQSSLAGTVAELFCELTGNERCSFASTGSEAVVGAIRLARTVTGRKKVVMFEGSYHGITDEVINRPGKNYQALPAAPGIPREATANMLVLPWGEASSLEVIKDLGSELAAVLVEPVQSRKPQFHDQQYLQSIRTITEETGTAMILDEVVTGFRVAAGGIRERFGIDADLGTYGKVVGGGHPIGIIGGKAKFMDALDGGFWQFGDESIPEVGVTFFAGTFVRHPIALAAANAILTRIKQEGSVLYETLEQKTAAMTATAKTFIEEMKCAVGFEYFASFFYVSVPTSAHWGHMLFTLMTLEGIHIQQYRPNFLTTEHSEADIEKILKAFKKSLAQLVCHGLIEGDMVAAKRFLSERPAIPEGARLGKNARGEPAYFIEDPKNKGQYIEVGKP